MGQQDPLAVPGTDPDSTYLELDPFNLYGRKLGWDGSTESKKEKDINIIDLVICKMGIQRV